MEEVDGKTQAELAIQLSDNVRDLVRMHLKQALEDPSFMGSLNSFNLSEAAQRHLSPGNINFQQAVKNVITNQMNKY
jgi:hypothetical protein